MESINFNKPYVSGKEYEYIDDAVNLKKIVRQLQIHLILPKLYSKKYGFQKCLLTTSCTYALEMAAIYLDIKPGDQVIMPSYTFVSTDNSFVLRGAKIVIADSMSINPNMDANNIEELITPKTKAIVPMH